MQAKELEWINFGTKERADEEKIETEEVMEAIREIKNGKSAGHDKITAAMIKSE